MKYSKTAISLFSIFFLLFFSLAYSELKAEDVFVEKESIVIVEIESAPINAGWLEGNATVSSKAIRYYTSKANYFNTPNQYTLTYKVQINNPGTYRFQWHSKVGEGTSSTDFNDTWLKMPDASDFYGQRSSGSIVHPKGVCTTDCPAGAGSSGWFKVYSGGTTNWTWGSKTSDSDGHEIYAKFNAVGIYTVLISARSKNHFLNRFVMYNTAKYTESQATDLARVESEKLGANGIDDKKILDLEVYPNPASTHLKLSANIGDLACYEIVDITGQTKLYGSINNRIEHIDISTLVNGMYIIKCYNTKNAFNSIKFNKQN